MLSVYQHAHEFKLVAAAVAGLIGLRRRELEPVERAAGPGLRPGS
jgi:hypothetical protein